MDKRFADLQNVIDIQRSPGNYDFDPYMHGILNGLIMAQAILTNKEPVFVPVFVTAPDNWLRKETTPYEGLCKALQNDSGYAWSWHCNIAVHAMDEGVDHATAQQIASRVMQGCFQADTSGMDGGRGIQK
jgi:hypothetical protein